MNSLITTHELRLDPPSASDKRADRERLLDTLARAGVPLPVEVSPGLLRRLPGLLRQSGFVLRVTLGALGDRMRVVSLDTPAAYGLAVDVGTTNIAASLFDMATLGRLGAGEHENPQISLGLDVLTRVQAAMSGRGRELRELLAAGVNALINKLCELHGINAGDICAATVTGNTIMTHFLLGLPVENLPVDPYIPAAHRIGFVPAAEAGLSINDEAVVYVFPNAGSYVGGDIIAGILHAGLYLHDEPSLLIDVGTNAEIVLGSKDWLMVAAGAAGPALESGISGIGMRAAPGAVAGVALDSATHRAILTTIGGHEPRGLCGSGMIELIAELYDKGVIDGRGRLSALSPRVLQYEGGLAFLLYEGEAGRLLVKDTDIDNFLRSKAAMFASLSVMTRAVGLGFGDIRRVFVSGAFGSGINAEKAARIGMLPAFPRERIAGLGNSSLKGAELLLLNRAALADISRICSLITYREMNADGEFMREFPAALFIPHTDPDALGM